MTRIITRHNYPQPQQSPDELFTGIFMRWRVLTLPEKVVCANIILIPVWWIVGLKTYMLTLLSLGIVVHDYRRYGRVSLKRPSGMVIALFAYYAYGYIDNFFLLQGAYTSIKIPSNIVVNPNSLVKMTFAFAVPFLVWYLQSNRIKVRLEVVMWSCTVTIIMMLLSWLFVQYALPASVLTNPPRTIYAFLTGKGTFNPEDVGGWGNYLVFIEARESETRVRFFFDHYQTAAIFLAFAALLALDLKNRLWSGSLIVICCFLLILAAARAVWIALLPAIFCRYLWLAAKSKIGWLFFAIVAIFSFSILSLPPVTQGIYNAYTSTTEYVANARAGSTEARSKVYQLTLEKIPDKIIFGHKVPGEPAITGPTVFAEQPPPIGTHSFILGDLLYQKGVLGTGIFATFWTLLVIWFYKTRIDRPLGSFLFLLMLTLTSIVSIIHSTMITCTLICMMLRQPMIRQPRKNIHRSRQAWLS